MKKIIPSLLIALFVSCGCARHYVITLNSGHQITTKSKPRLKGPVYYFKDLQGKPAHVTAGQVSRIAPASMTKSGTTEFEFLPRDH